MPLRWVVRSLRFWFAGSWFLAKLNVGSFQGLGMIKKIRRPEAISPDPPKASKSHFVNFSATVCLLLLCLMVRCKCSARCCRHVPDLLRTCLFGCISSYHVDSHRHDVLAAAFGTIFGKGWALCRQLQGCLCVPTALGFLPAEGPEFGSVWAFTG